MIQRETLKTNYKQMKTNQKTKISQIKEQTTKH